MSVEKTIANIPNMTAQQRDSLRVNVIDKLAGGDGKWIKDAQVLVTALDDLTPTRSVDTAPLRKSGLRSSKVSRRASGSLAPSSLIPPAKQSVN